MNAIFVKHCLDTLMARLGIGRLGRNALLSTVGLGTRAVIQAAYLIVLSHWMGPKDYGLFAGSVAAAILIAPISGWGISAVLTQQVARDQAMSRSLWAAAILQVFLSGAILMAVLVLASELMLVDRVSIGSMLMLGFAELIALPLAQVATSVCLALDQGLSAALSMCLVPTFRLAAVVMSMLLSVNGTPSHVAALHFAGSVLGVLAAVTLIANIDGLPAWRDRLPLRKTTINGTHFAIGALVGTSYQEVDKVLLLQLLGATVVGTYTAAFRVMSVFVLPISALVGAALPRLFAVHGRPEGPRMLNMISLSAIGYSLAASVAAACVSPFMSQIFGVGFAMSSRYLLMLSPWAIVFALHQSAATGLTAWEGQSARVLVEALGIALVVGLNLSLLPSFGAGAAAFSLLITEIFMAGGCWFFLHRQSR